MPYAAWDRAQMQALREENRDDVIWQQLLAAMAADPQRFYQPLATAGRLGICSAGLLPTTRSSG